MNTQEIVLRAKSGPAARVAARRLDHEHADWVDVSVRWQDGQLTLEKATDGSAAFLVRFAE